MIIIMAISLGLLCVWHHDTAFTKKLDACIPALAIMIYYPMHACICSKGIILSIIAKVTLYLHNKYWDYVIRMIINDNAQAC